MSGGFFRGTTADQDTRFSNKHAKLLKSQKFHPELEHLVDMTKVKMDVMRPWIAQRVTEYLGFEDEVLINFICGLLEEKVVNGKEIQISLTGFMEKNTGKFMKELWTHLLSAQENASGVPQQFLDAKEEETRKKQEDTDRITRELKRAKEKEGRELDQERSRRTRDKEDHGNERVKMDRAVDNVKAANMEPHSRRQTKFSSKWSADDKVTDEKNGSQEMARIPGSPHFADRSLSPTRGTRSRSISRSITNSRSPSRSRSLSASPKPLRRSVSSERRHHTLSRRSNTPRRMDSRLRSPSPAPSPFRRRFRSPVRRRSRSPLRRRSRSPIRRRSRSPIRWRSRSPIRRRSRSPIRRRSRSPISRRSRSPIRRRARSPIRRRSRSPIRRRSPFRRRSPSPFRRRSPSPFRRRSPSPFRRRSPSPFQGRPRSPYRHKSQSPVSPSRNVSLSPSPVRCRSPSPMRRRNQRAPSTPRHQSPSPVRRKLTNSGQRRSPSPGSVSSSPSGRISLSPKRDTPPSMLRRGSPKRQQRSPSESPRDGYRVTQRNAPDRQMPRKEIAERPSESRKASSFSEILPPPPPLPKGLRVPALSPSPYHSPDGSVSPPAARTPSKERSPIPRKRQRESLNSKDRVDRVELEEKAFSRRREERHENKNSVNDKYDKSKYSPEKLTSHLSTGTQAQKRTSTNDEGRRKYSELSDEPSRSRKDVLSSERERVPEKGYKVDNINQESVKLGKALPTVERQTRSGSFDSGSEESDHKKKRKRLRRKDVTSDDDDSHDSHIEDRKEAKRRHKEERKLKKEEKRRRREERRHKKDSRRTEKLKLKAGGDVSPSSDLDKSHDSRDEALSDPKKLEIELREKALESLRAKKGVGH